MTLSYHPGFDVFPTEEQSVSRYLKQVRLEMRKYMSAKFNTFIRPGCFFDYDKIIEESIISQHDASDIPPEYEILLSVSNSDVAPDEYDYTGDMVFKLTMEAFCVKRIVSSYPEEPNIPLDDCHRILYWASTTYIGQKPDEPDGPDNKDVGQRGIAVPFSGEIERVIFLDPYGNPSDDSTRVAYRATWNVDFTYIPQSGNATLPEIVDRSFGTKLPAGYKIEDNVHIEFDGEFDGADEESDEHKYSEDYP